MKICTGCRTAKPVSMFHRDNRTKDGLRYKCKTCLALWHKDYSARNAEKLKASKAAFYDANRERQKQWSVEWRKRNKEHIAEYRLANKAKRNAVVQAWCRTHPEAMRALAAIKRARKRLAGGSHTQNDIKALLRLQKGRCPSCGTDIRKLYHVDHVKPIAAGGSNDRHNLQLLCPQCNMSKHTKDPVSFMQSRGFLL